MVFSRRMAALAAVVLIPLGIAATSFALTDSPARPEVPAGVELESGSPAPARTSAPASAPASTPPSTPDPTPSDQVVSRPPVTDRPPDDDDDDEPGRGADDGSEDADDGVGAGDDG
ncbi:small secreted hydrophilic protein [Streptomyces sp. JW3]|uniref:small secreted hydrophilic protein n=1 Tax=Streptomyces sp. JW3 TaxID=3456955 RepID=UPI003FA446BF